MSCKSKFLNPKGTMNWIFALAKIQNINILFWKSCILIKSSFLLIFLFVIQESSAQAIRYNHKMQKKIFYKSAKTLLDVGIGAETSVLILPYASAEFSVNIFPSRYFNLKIRSRFSSLINTNQQTYEFGFEMKPEGSSNFSNHGDFTSVSFFYGMKKTYLKNEIGENIYHYFDGRIEIAWSKYEKNDLFYSVFVAYATKYHNNFSNSSPFEKFNLNIGVHFYLI